MELGVRVILNIWILVIRCGYFGYLVDLVVLFIRLVIW